MEKKGLAPRDLLQLVIHIHIWHRLQLSVKPVSNEFFGGTICWRSVSHLFRVPLKLIASQQRRSHSVASALREKHRQIYSALSQLPDGHDTPHIPIFCVGSCDYLCAGPPFSLLYLRTQAAVGVYHVFCRQHHWFSPQKKM